MVRAGCCISKQNGWRGEVQAGIRLNSGRHQPQIRHYSREMAGRKEFRGEISFADTARQRGLQRYVRSMGGPLLRHHQDHLGKEDIEHRPQN